MIDKDFLRGFLRFLDAASAAELRDRLAQVRAFASDPRLSAHIRADAKFLQRKLEEELFARAGLNPPREERESRGRQ